MPISTIYVPTKIAHHPYPASEFSYPSSCVIKNNKGMDTSQRKLSGNRWCGRETVSSLTNSVSRRINQSHSQAPEAKCGENEDKTPFLLNKLISHFSSEVANPIDNFSRPVFRPPSSRNARLPDTFTGVSML
ncbi:hypothetical protein AVEN_134121-1 [Araneus ventricosus]|uniref:Uncharacterized protein n=1 Tax=Araneus ventricosus TaxID=182803 RepID=A0A4Y2X214_ARAVE|nr:hypothetical protein AVEN_134121-1 [Araneus ventricosus]